MMIKGSQHTKASMDTRRRVFVKRLFREAPFRCCEATLSRWKFLQIAMLQTHMMIVRPNEMGMKTYKIDSNEIETCNKVINVDNKTENVQTKTCYRKLYKIYGRPCEKSHILLFKADSNLQQRKYKRAEWKLLTSNQQTPYAYSELKMNFSYEVVW